MYDSEMSATAYDIYVWVASITLMATFLVAYGCIVILFFYRDIYRRRDGGGGKQREKDLLLNKE